ncbi:recombinase family protein [Eubacterium multiforme]|uniref:DNA invertase Pin-like site-specific DNA recombinase n=1 Tax=Eubacterium multiforme TaxID=83339 RepID=A0ABT9US65_9FIRM|nr:recombinase family protein [Eubacterium multiforme]MDQ0149161.1 DNA invertase Pin-like site-specific DNA recombinase [Eubacterium multiforme]
MIVAIYSRKSKFTGKGDSIENQIEMCKEYIKTHISDEVDFLVYEDEGFSGGNINRPEFKNLMNDIKHRKINLLICYRLDRISRNVSDFSSVLETLQENKVDFISIKEQFDTSSPMGRAMIYIASVFAQLERETIAERIKDNMLEMAKNGKWTGGKIPLGFKSNKITYIDDEGKKRHKSSLEHEPKDLEFVKFLYEKYLELGSLHKLEVYTHQNNISSISGKIFEKSTLKIILQNPIYVKANSSVVDYLTTNGCKVYGEVDNLHSLLSYNKTESIYKNGKLTKANKEPSERFASVSNILGYLEPELWLKVQLQFDRNKDTFPRLGKTHNALLIGKLFCGNCKSRMLIQHGKVSTKTGEKLFYYVCSLKRTSKRKLCNSKNISLSKIEKTVLKTLKNLSYDSTFFLDNLNIKYNDTSNNKAALLSLNKSLEDKKSQIDVLVNKLSLDHNNLLTEVLFEKITNLKKECIELNNKINSIKKEKIKLENESLEISFIETLINKCSYIENLSHNEQKQLIDSLVDTIYYYPPDKDGNDKIKINFVGSLDIIKN